MTDDVTPLTARELARYRRAQTRGDRSRLEWFGYKSYSQSDEDGIIERIFSLIGAPHRTFVEFGCEGGTENNTRHLLEQGWSGLWMEANPSYAVMVRNEFAARLESGQLRFREAFVNAGNINDLIRESGLAGEIDLLSIDIDSLDYHVWKAIDVVSPRVVVIEHNHCYLPGEEYIMAYDTDYRWDPASGRAEYGASITSMAALAGEKGYTLVGCGLFSANGFYVRSDLVRDAFTGPFTAERLFNPLVYELILRFPRGKPGLIRRALRLLGR